MKSKIIALSLMMALSLTVEAAQYTIKIPTTDIKSADVTPDAKGIAVLADPQWGKQNILALSDGTIYSGSIKNIDKGTISAIGFLTANYTGYSTGIITIKLCVNSACSTQSVDIKNTSDNTYSDVTLNKPLTTNKNDTLTYSFSGTGSINNYKPVIYTWPLDSATASVKANVSSLSSYPGRYPAVRITYK